MLSYIRKEEFDLHQTFDALPNSIKNHCQRVAQIVELLAKKVYSDGFFPDEPIPDPDILSRAALYHDIGLVMIPERLLNKEQEPTAAEYRVINRHTIYGSKLLQRYSESSKCPKEEVGQWRLAAQLALSHHERWDGDGTPHGLLATAISPVCHWVGVADMFDWIVYGLPWRMPLPPAYALLEIAELSGKAFDPALTASFIQMTESSLACEG